jgi:hypothetical protein
MHFRRLLVCPVLGIVHGLHYRPFSVPAIVYTLLGFDPLNESNYVASKYWLVNRRLQWRTMRMEKTRE